MRLEGTELGQTLRSVMRSPALQRIRQTFGSLAAQFSEARTLRICCPAILALALFPWIKIQIQHEVVGTLFRDAAMCQYGGWCVRHGLRLYRDIGAPDGPFIHMLHAAMQVFVGTSDESCRKADLVVHSLGSAIMGAALAPGPAAGTRRTPAIVHRVAWAALSSILWLSWYLPAGGNDHTVQRDPFYALFGYLGMVLLYASADCRPRQARWMAFAGAALATMQLFTRQSGVVYVAMGALSILLTDDGETEHRAVRWRAAVVGSCVGFAAMLLFVALAGSLSGFWYWYIQYPLGVYRFVGKHNPWRLLTDTYASAATVAIVILSGVLAAVATKILPRRAVGFAFAPALFLIAACLVGKGWPMHVMQTTAAANVVLLVLLARLWGLRPGRRWSVLAATPAALVLMFAGYHAIDALRDGVFNTQVGEKSPDVVRAISVGDYLRKHTQPNDSVFLYGHEAHVLLAAERRSAIPYYVNVLFGVGVLMDHQPPEPGEEPNAAQLAKFHQMTDAIAADGCAKLVADPPAAMVFLDRSLGVWGYPYGVADAARLCPAIPKMLDQYHEVPVIAPDYHVYLRHDRRP